MDKATRNNIQRATQQARRLLEDEFREQLEGTFDILLDGTIADEAGPHLSKAERAVRQKLVTVIAHKAAAGLDKSAAVAAYLREAAFTTLNRFVALKMLEVRELVQECVSQWEESSGFTEFTALAPGLTSNTENGYRLYLETIFDELGQEVRVLFDRWDVASLLWPRRKPLGKLLMILNDSSLESVWIVDETIGWVYQYFNDDEDRKQARYDEKGKPKAPSTSRELAVRNQFFTPRFVVQFLADNTLGRLWYEMNHGNTRLRGLTYLVHQPEELFLAKDEVAPETGELSESEAEQRPVVPFRPKKDPRDIRVLDPACGSGHFLLYTFDLLFDIYEEAWEDDNSPPWEPSGQRLSEDYPKRDTFRRVVPELILKYNLHGIDIDPRCTQIAGLALWMRAQRAWSEMNVERASRPVIRKANIAVAEPMPGEDALRAEFVESLEPELHQLLNSVFESMKLAGEAGSLLKIEAVIQSEIRKAYGESGPLFRSPDEERWRMAEEKLLSAFGSYALQAQIDNGYQTRLFAEDAARGLGFVALCRQRYDVILMNPPFGECSPSISPLVKKSSSVEDLFCAFVHRGLEFAPSGFLGAITNASFLLYTDFSMFRDFLRERSSLSLLADLGWGVLDASVQTAMYTLTPRQAEEKPTLFIDLASSNKRAQTLQSAVHACNARETSGRVYRQALSSFNAIESSPFCFRFGPAFFKWVNEADKLEDCWQDHGIGAGPHNFFFRLRWELPLKNKTLADNWPVLANGGRFSPYFRDNPLHIDWGHDGRKIKAHLNHIYPYLKGNVGIKIQREHVYRCPGVTYGKRTGRFNAQILPAGAIPSFEGIGAYPNSADDTWWLLAYMNSRFVAFFLNMTCGQHKNAVYIDRVPVPLFDEDQKAAMGNFAQQLFAAQREACSIKETSVSFKLPALLTSDGGTLAERMIAWRRSDRELEVEMWSSLASIERTIWNEVSVTPAIFAAIEEDQGPDMSCQDHEPQNVSLPPPDAITGPSRPAVSRGETFETDLFRLAFSTGLTPRAAADRLNKAKYFDESEFYLRTAELVSFLFGLCNGRFSLPTQKIKISNIWVDDPGHPEDIVPSVASLMTSLFPDSQFILDELANALGSDSLRLWLRSTFFSFHQNAYSMNRRKAPIYWQLATPKANYSVWLYYPSLTRDSFHTLLNDYVAPKLHHEQRRLKELHNKNGTEAATVHRQLVERQESLVEELQIFRQELTRVAPLWNPNFEDGVNINFAPLWRLVPHQGAWQKHCRKTWEKLVAGDYDWAHLAMHLWPERVVPKCVKNRSLAIAHDLEQIFWAEDSHGKWHPRHVETDRIDQLVKDRTSAAVKAALNDLLSAPTPSGSTGRKRKKSTKRSKR